MFAISAKPDFLEELGSAEISIVEEFGEAIFSRKKKESLAQVLFEKLREQNQTVSFAESCSGGKLADEFVSIPGSSEVFISSLVTYANSAKEKFLDIPSEILETKGAVSSEVSELMAKNVRLKTGSDFALSITGIAGPAGDTTTKKVGDVYIGMSSDKETASYYYNFPFGRNRFRSLCVATALNLLRLELED